MIVIPDILSGLRQAREAVKLTVARFALKNERGFTLIEVIIALLLLGILAGAFFNALGTGSKVLFNTDDRETAKNLAEMQMEYIQQSSIATSYTPVSMASYPGYSANITVTYPYTGDNNIQKITVTVWNLNTGKTLMTLSTYKVR